MAPIMVATIKTPLTIAGKVKRRMFVPQKQYNGLDAIGMESLGSHNTCTVIRIVSVSYS